MPDQAASHWVDANRLGRALPRGIGVTLAVGDINAEIAFCRDVLGAFVLEAGAPFTVLELCGSVLLLRDLTGADDAADPGGRCDGMEIRVAGLDPDKVAARAARAGHAVLAPAADAEHGMRECRIASPAGYVWVPGVATA